RSYMRWYDQPSSHSASVIALIPHSHQARLPDVEPASNALHRGLRCRPRAPTMAFCGALKVKDRDEKCWRPDAARDERARPHGRPLQACCDGVRLPAARSARLAAAVGTERTEVNRRGAPPERSERGPAVVQPFLLNAPRVLLAHVEALRDELPRPAN